MLINVELESESGLAGDVVKAGDSDEHETVSCLKELVDMEEVDPGGEGGGVRDEVKSMSGAATLDSV